MLAWCARPVGSCVIGLLILGCGGQSELTEFPGFGGAATGGGAMTGGTTSLGGAHAQSGAGGEAGAAAPVGFEGTNSGLTFSAARGVYSEPFDLTITHGSIGELRYTLDCSDPRSSSTALVAALPLTLRIDPANTQHRFLAPGVVVRATAYGVDAPANTVTTHTYLFLNRVVELSPDGRRPGPQWPEPFIGDGWGGAQVIDYGMDRDVTAAPEYAPYIDEALRAIPSVSLVTDLPHLFDPDTGIYVNAEEDGDAWERFGSVELLNADASPGFQANTGVRIRGGYSRTGWNPKHAFRLFFRTAYGTSKLRFPVFGDEGAAAFDRLDLRTSQNYSWAFEGDAYDVNTMVRDVFSRDLQRELGRPYTRSRFYHLYVNGVPWGIFQSQERAESNFARTYFGGSSDDYDVIKVDKNLGYNIVASEGTLGSWTAVWEVCRLGFASDDRYYRLEGKDASGNRDPSLPVLVDIDNLIDYMLVIFYTANVDGPVSKFLSNVLPNNFYAIKNRNDPNQGYVFFAHDSEHTLLADPIRVTSGVTENRVNIGVPGGATGPDGVPSSDYQMTMPAFRYFHPQWLHHRLTENPRYRQRFAARAQAVLTGDGEMTPAFANALLQSRADEIDLAIIVESARWGDAKRPYEPHTRNDSWLPALLRTKQGFIDRRTPIVSAQLRELGLFP